MHSEQDILNKILQRLVRVETKIDTLTTVERTATEAKDTANKAHISANTAHKRLDKIDRAIFWLVTSIVGGIITSVMALIFVGGN